MNESKKATERLAGDHNVPRSVRDPDKTTVLESKVFSIIDLSRFDHRLKRSDQSESSLKLSTSVGIVPLHFPFRELLLQQNLEGVKLDTLQILFNQRNEILEVAGTHSRKLSDVDCVGSDVGHQVSIIHSGADVVQGFGTPLVLRQS